MPSRRFQASFVGPDLARHTAGVTVATKADAEAWLGAQQRTITDGTWERDAAAARLRREGNRAPEHQVKTLMGSLEQVADDLDAGAVVVLTNDNIGIRRLLIQN